MLRRAMVAGCCVALLAGPGLAQTTTTLPASPPLPPLQSAPDPHGGDVPAEPTLPPYQRQLERLAALMGTLAYLRDLCGRADGAEWRNRMAALLDAEAGTPTRRERLAGAFNEGFRGYEATYKVCTPAAELVIRRFVAEGDGLTRDLAAHFGGG